MKPNSAVPGACCSPRWIWCRRKRWFSTICLLRTFSKSRGLRRSLGGSWHLWTRSTMIFQLIQLVLSQMSPNWLLILCWHRERDLFIIWKVKRHSHFMMFGPTAEGTTCFPPRQGIVWQRHLECGPIFSSISMALLCVRLPCFSGGCLRAFQGILPSS